MYVTFFLKIHTKGTKDVGYSWWHHKQQLQQKKKSAVYFCAFISESARVGKCCFAKLRALRTESAVLSELDQILVSDHL